MTLGTLLLALLLGFIPAFLFIRPFYTVRQRAINDKGTTLSQGKSADPATPGLCHVPLPLPLPLSGGTT